MLNFFPTVLASNPGETISEKGMWRSSVTPCLLYISVTEVAQQIWGMVSVEESRRLWGSVVLEQACRLFGTQLSSAFPKVKQACAQHLQSLHMCMLWLYTLPELSAPVPRYHLMAPTLIMSAGFCLHPAQLKPFVVQMLMLAVVVFSQGLNFYSSPRSFELCPLLCEY